MNRILAIIVTIAWGLWFGGMIALFLFVTRLFAADMGPQAAPVLFQAFEIYQLVVGAITLIAALGWYYSSHSRCRAGLLILLILAGIAAVTSTTLITPRINELRLQGQTKTDEFRKLHGRSMMVYSSEAVLLLLGGIAIGLESRPETPAVS